MIALTYQNYLRLTAEKARIEKELTEVRDQLKQGISPNTSLDGVFHKVSTRKSVKWAEASRRIIDILVAETKKQKAWDMVEQLTSYDEVHSFEPAKDSILPADSFKHQEQEEIS